MKMKNNYVLIKEIKEEQFSKGGLLLPNDWNTKRKAIVIEVEDNDQIKKGDIILREHGKSTEVIIDNETYEMIHLNNIMMVI
jgi:co-chaperonin GroES (HSP10)